jgi:spheroidene monooxygenase
MPVTTLTVFRFDGTAQRVWAFAQMLWARRRLRAMPDVRFFKLVGSGTRDGFWPAPNFGVYGILAVWPDLQVARARVADDPAYAAHRRRASEDWTIYLEGVSARGTWAGAAPFLDADAGAPAVDLSAEPVVAVLTRATLRAAKTPVFWSQVPGISTDIAKQDRLRFAIGIGEVPWLHQATFTVWDDVAAMETFAQTSFHGAAVERAYKDGWFKECLFARFRVLETSGRWQGGDPLAPFLTARSAAAE